MAAISQSCVFTAQYALLLSVQSQCWICAALEGSYIMSWGFYGTEPGKDSVSVCVFGSAGQRVITQWIWVFMLCATFFTLQNILP